MGLELDVGAVRNVEIQQHGRKQSLPSDCHTTQRWCLYRTSSRTSRVTQEPPTVTTATSQLGYLSIAQPTNHRLPASPNMSQLQETRGHGVWFNGWDQVLPPYQNGKRTVDKVVGAPSSEGPGKPIIGELLAAPPDQVAPNDKLRCAGVVRISPIPDPTTWPCTTVKMAIYDDSANAHGNFRQWSLMESFQGKMEDSVRSSCPTIEGGQKLKGDPDALYFVFKNVTFPKANPSYGPWRFEFSVHARDEVVGRLKAKQNMEIKEGAVRTNPHSKFL